MNKLSGILAAVVLVAFAIFDIAKEGREVLGLGLVLIFLTLGLVMWALFTKMLRYQTGRNSGLPIKVALWLHSALEGALAAISFHFGFAAGMLVSIGLLIHLVPEGLAILAALKRAEYSYRHAVKTYVISVGLLLFSFNLFNFALPHASQILLTALATAVGGAMVYIATQLTYQTFAN